MLRVVISSSVIGGFQGQREITGGDHRGEITGGITGGVHLDPAKTWRAYF